MKQWRMVIDIAKCHDCNNCLLACKDEHVDNVWPGYTASQPRQGHRWIRVERTERGQFPLVDVAFRPTPCMHCASPACASAAPEAFRLREDGIVLINPEAARGRKELVDACPYGAIYWNEAEQTAQKCTFCAHLLDNGWQGPRCVQSCPTGALQMVRMDDREASVFAEQHGLSTLHPEMGTEPRVFYANMSRFASCFIAGSVAFQREGLDECAAGARVVLFRFGNEQLTTTTDAFGDFRFDGLAPRTAGYSLAIEHSAGSAQVESIAGLERSLTLPPILLFSRQ